MYTLLNFTDGRQGIFKIVGKALSLVWRSKEAAAGKLSRGVMKLPEITS